jgi:hypothetical protein
VEVDPPSVPLHEIGVPLSFEPKRTLSRFLHGMAKILPLYVTLCENLQTVAWANQNW